MATRRCDLSPTSRGPLDGVRVADFTWQWAGPSCTQLLGLLGAEVIRIESLNALDVMRSARLTSRTGRPDSVAIESNVSFHDVNLNKFGIRINLKHPSGQVLAKKLVAVSDLVVENFRPGTMARYGLDYPHLREIKPDIIMLSISSSGDSGPERNSPGWAVIWQALGGLGYLTGYPDDRPAPVIGQTDIRAGMTAAFAAVTALLYKQRTGRGQFIDFAARENVVAHIGDEVMHYTMNREVRGRRGNGDDCMAPHDCFPCLGVDQWVSIAVEGDGEWHRFCDAAGHEEWMLDKRFATHRDRKSNETALYDVVSLWTSGFTKWAITEKLQSKGIAAFPSMSNMELVLDEHLRQRDTMPEVEHPVMGRRRVVGPPWKFSRTPARVTLPAPMLGQHNPQILLDLLQLSEQEVADLTKDGALD